MEPKAMFNSLEEQNAHTDKVPEDLFFTGSPNAFGVPEALQLARHEPFAANVAELAY